LSILSALLNSERCKKLHVTERANTVPCRSRSG
jgi:hypothetical protein